MTLNRTLSVRWIYNLLLAALLLLALGSAPGMALPARAEAGSQFYVSPTGNDANDGRSLDRPFRTIQKCAAVAAAGDTCWVRGGTYRETVTPARSGASGSPIAFRAFGGEAAIVSGAEPLTGWSRHSGSIYKTSMPWNLDIRASLPEPQATDNQLFVAGQMMPLARWPNVLPEQLTRLTNSEEAQADSASVASASEATYHDADLSAVPAGLFNGAKISFAPGLKLLHTTCTVRAQTAGAVSFRCDPDSAAWGNAASLTGLFIPAPANYYYLWGALAALDAPGEWFRDPAGALYLWAPDGGAPRDVEARRRLWAFDLAGRQHIVVEGYDIR